MPRKGGRDTFKPWRPGGVPLGHVRSGIYWIDRTVHGRRYRISTGCRTAEAALAEYQRFEKDPSHYVPRSGTGTSWDDAVRDYLEYSRQGKLNSERHVYYQAAGLANVGSFVRGGSRVFSSLDVFTAADVRAYVQWRTAGGIEGRKVGAPSINRELAYIKGLMRWARENRRTVNEADTEVPLLREEQGINLPRSIPPKEWRAILGKLGKRWRLACEVMLGAGLRYSELSRLDEGSIREGAIHVPRAKSRRARTVPVSARTVLSARALVTLGGVPDDRAGQIDHRLAVACRAAKVERYTAHEFRHTYATTCLRNGVDLRELQERLGHASIATTERYLHALRADDPAKKRVGAPL